MSWVATLIVAGTAVSAYGQYQQGKAAEAQGKAEQQIAEYNAKIKEKEAAAALERSREEARQFAKEGEVLMGEQRVRLAKGGVLSTEGTPALLLEETAQELEADRMSILREGFLGESFAMSQAEGLRAEGRAAKARGKNAKTGSYYAAGSSLLTGFGAAGSAGGKTTDAKLAKKHGIPYP